MIKDKALTLVLKEKQGKDYSILKIYDKLKSIIYNNDISITSFCI